MTFKASSENGEIDGGHDLELRTVVDEIIDHITNRSQVELGNRIRNSTFLRHKQSNEHHPGSDSYRLRRFFKAFCGRYPERLLALSNTAPEALIDLRSLGRCLGMRKAA